MSPDPLFADPELAALYDVLLGDRTDLDLYEALADECGAASILDVGRGTGTFQRSLALARFDLADVRDAPDRPGLEFVCVARRRT